MSTTTLAQYAVWTQDSTTASATVQANLDLAEQYVAEYLRRADLGHSERTEQLRVHRGGKVYPPHTPITGVPAGASYRQDGTATLWYVTPDSLVEPVAGLLWPRSDDYPSSLPRATVVYTGGWTSDTLPAAIQRVVSLAARTLAGQAAPLVPGAKRVMVGDVSVDYTDAVAAAAHVLDTLCAGATTHLRNYRWRPL